LTAAINSDTNNLLTLKMRRVGVNADGNPNLAFRSKEDITVERLAPTLDITATVPEPGMMGMTSFLLALAALGYRRRVQQ
jgi:hypothetical protein